MKFPQILVTFPLTKQENWSACLFTRTHFTSLNLEGYDLFGKNCNVIPFGFATLMGVIWCEAMYYFVLTSLYNCDSYFTFSVECSWLVGLLTFRVMSQNQFKNKIFSGKRSSTNQAVYRQYNISNMEILLYICLYIIVSNLKYRIPFYHKLTNTCKGFNALTAVYNNASIGENSHSPLRM